MCVFVFVSVCVCVLVRAISTPSYRTAHCLNATRHPAAERYRYFMVKMLARRGAAQIWSGDFVEGLNDYRVAMSYQIEESIDIAIDLQVPPSARIASASYRSASYQVAVRVIFCRGRGHPNGNGQ